MSPDYSYTAYGLGIASCLPCPRLRSGSGPPDVFVRCGSLPDGLPGARSGGVCYQATSNQLLLSVPGVARFLVSDGREILVERAANADDDDVRLFLLGPALGALLQQRGLLVFEGSAIEASRGAVALLGHSGAGKSTIVQLLMRYYKLTSGQILVDGKNINEYNLTDLRKNIAIVPQEVMLFGGTIYENIAYGNPQATENEVIEASRKANAFDFINSFPEGFQTIVGERGVKLSGGQRQRVAIARAILKDPAILILDEATSALDSESEKLVQDALDRLMQNRTTIIIAHRLATIRNVDTIYVLKEGEISESGSHDELLLMENGIYSNLVKLQYENAILEN